MKLLPAILRNLCYTRRCMGRRSAAGLVRRRAPVGAAIAAMGEGGAVGELRTPHAWLTLAALAAAAPAALAQQLISPPLSSPPPG